MTGKIIVAGAVLAAFALGTVAEGATGWRVFATGSDSADYGAYVSASADVQKPKALAVRGSKPGEISWYLNCEGSRKVPAGRVVVVNVLGSKQCTLNGSLDTDVPGLARVELLRR